MHRRTLLLLLLLLWGCSSPPPTLPPLAADATLLAFGDSLTYGTGAEQEGSYPAQLAALSGHEVINAGLPGETSAEGALRLPELLDEYQPQLLLLCHGGNDLLRQWDPAVTRGHLQEMVAAARSRGIPVVLIGIPKPALFSLESAAYYGELAAELELPYEGEILPKVLADSALKADQVHPNAAGYRQIARRLHELLVASGALP